MEIVTELIGWMSALVLAMTLSRQVYAQWKTKSAKGVSRWLFIGQLTASAGFVVYSFLLDNWVFVATNAFNFCVAVLGQYIYSQNKEIDREKAAAQGA